MFSNQPSTQNVLSYIENSQIELAIDELTRLPRVDKEFTYKLLEIIRGLDNEIHEVHRAKGRAIAQAVKLNTSKLEQQNEQLKTEISRLQAQIKEISVKYGPKPERTESSYNEYLYSSSK
ncbi:hypothetical protein ACEWA3_23045 [Vibrio parahaemolyticus]